MIYVQAEVKLVAVKIYFDESGSKAADLIEKVRSGSVQKWTVSA